MRDGLSEYDEEMEEVAKRAMRQFYDRAEENYDEGEEN